MPDYSSRIYEITREKLKLRVLKNHPDLINRPDLLDKAVEEEFALRMKKLRELIRDETS